LRNGFNPGGGEMRAARTMHTPIDAGAGRQKIRRRNMKTMMKTTIAVAAMAFATVTMPAFAPSQAAASEMSGTAIRAAIKGKTVMLKTRWGGFPLRYATSGSVTGDGTALGLARFFAPKETGRWWVDGNKLCQQFPTWYSGRTTCFTLTRKDEATLRWEREDGYSGTAVIRG
jgi:hypothetical protein